jgi:DME family drug/metabolite transporter
MPDGTPKATKEPMVRSIGLILAAAALFGTTGTVLANGPVNVDAVTAGVVRLLVGGLGLVILSWRYLREVASHTKVAFFGAIGVGSYQLCFFYSTRHAGVAVATIITIGSSPLFARFIGALRRRPAPHRLWYLAALILVAGLILLSVSPNSGDSIEIIGVLAALVAGLSYAAYTESAAILIGRELNSTAVMAALFFGAASSIKPINKGTNRPELV